MQQLEMEVEEEDVHVEETSRFLKGGGHRGRRKNGGGGYDYDYDESPSTTSTTTTTTRLGGLSRILLVAGTILGFWMLAYRVSNAKDAAALSPSSSTSSMSPPDGIMPASPVVAAPTSTSNVDIDTDADTDNEDNNNNNNTPTQPATTPKGPLVYSNMATIVPDPEHNLPIPDNVRETIADQWGKWHFWDGDEANRPVADYCGQYPGRDIPGDELPASAWQGDAVFVNHILDDAEQLVDRTMEAIYTEYGWGKPQPPEGLAERLKMFEWLKLDLATAGDRPPDKYNKRGDQGGGGWTTERSFDGLVRRLLHAMHTNDKFTVVLAGHSAAAGHGNHFRQSYMMQFHKVMAPVLARLGVQLVTRNLSQGGLGTMHNALGMKDLYGDEIDLILWDSGMTENEPAHVDFFLRQALLSGKKVPVLWGGLFTQLKDLHENVDADVGFFGNGMDGIKEVTSEEQAKEIPYAARFLKCANNRADLCKQNRFCATCWIDRSDVSRDKFMHIADKVPSQVKWHPGWRYHQLVGRVLALSMLEALQVAIQIWSDGTMGGPPLDDSVWHTNDYYNNIREKLKNYVGPCEQIAPQLPARICHTPLNGRSLFTPRANPHETSLLNLVKKAPNGYKPRNVYRVLYDGPDVHNKCYDVKPGEVDVWLVASNRRQLSSSIWMMDRSPRFLDDDIEPNKNEMVEDYIVEDERNLEAIVPGIGWQHHDEYPGNCDGTYDAICGRHYLNPCPLLGHHDSRGYLTGNELSGWLVMEIPKVKEGIIIMKVLTYLGPDANTKTKDWTQVNNGNRRLRHQKREEKEFSFVSETDFSDGLSWNQTDRRLTDLSTDDWAEGAIVDYAINGKITTLDRNAFAKKVQTIQRVFETITLLDDPNFGTKQNVEVAIRMRNCGRKCTLGVTHLYWA